MRAHTGRLPHDDEDRLAKFPSEAWKRLPGGIRKTVGMRRLRLQRNSSRYITEHNQRLSPGAPTLTFHPMIPQPRATIVSFLAALEVRIGVDVRTAGPAIAWDTETFLSPAAAAALPIAAINRLCTDISKTRVDALWAELVGYSIEVDPLQTEGPMVVKSDANGRHDGRLIVGPTGRKRAGVVYQRPIDSLIDGEFFEYRPIIMGDRIPIALESRMPFPHWGHHAISTRARPAAELFSPAETDLLLEFTARIGLEFGELDVLREESTGRLYVLDANRTPTRPHYMQAADEKQAYAQMAATFAEAFPQAVAR